MNREEAVIQEIGECYASSASRSSREPLRRAIAALRGQTGVAVDCGCGAGADISFLAKSGFRVFAFDSNEGAIAICRKRFQENENVTLSHCCFSEFEFPDADLIVAESSLCFCPKDTFEAVWTTILNSLNRGGVFYGTFLGGNDTMANPKASSARLWGEVNTFEEPYIRDLLSSLQILHFEEIRSKGKDFSGESYSWHLFSVVARK